MSEDDVGDVAAWHIDPDRRPGVRRRRTTRLGFSEPTEEEVSRLRKANPHCAVKLAPAAQLAEIWGKTAELEWISRGGQCRQLVAWCGELAAHPGQRAATVIGARGDVMARIVADSPIAAPISSQPLRFVYEPDAAVRAADLGGRLAQRLGLSGLVPGGAYLTGDRPLEHATLASFEVIETMPLDLKRLRTWLRERRIGRLEIKKRAAPVEPEALLRQLRNPGEESATLLIYRLEGQVTVIAARRLAPP